MKTIMVHMADDGEYPNRLAAALALAGRRGSHVIGVCTHPPSVMPAPIRGRGASAAFLRQIKSTIDEHERAMRAAFEAATAKAGVPAEWRHVEGDAMQGLSLHTRYADLAVVSQTPPENFEEWLTGDCPDHLALTAACPTLVVPHGRRSAAVGERILVAWKSTREASRAVRDALPLLWDAERVTVLTVGPAETDHLPGADIATYLARHGAPVETRTNYGAGEPGDVVLAHAREIEADLIVMGAYGRSRLREIILGGTTKHVLSHAAVPVCLSH